MFSHTISAILRGSWLIDKRFAESHMPVVFKMLSGESVDFGFKTKYNDNEHNDNALETSVYRKAVLLANTSNTYKVSPRTNLDTVPLGSNVVIDIVGPVLKYGDVCSYGSVDTEQLINRSVASPNISSIILNIDSPGGQADGTASLADTIKKASAVKPVVAIINDGMAASAAMWIASAAQEIYVTQKTDQVGSVGVYTTIADWKTHYQEYFKLPVKDVYSSLSTDKNKIYQDAIDGDITGLQTELDVLANQFIDTVATNRAGKIKGDKWKTGKMFYANDAVNIGLIDGIKSFEQVVKRVEKLTKIKNSNSNNNNTMAFEKTMAVAGATEFKVVDDGFVLSEEQLNKVEAYNIESESNAQALAQAQSSIDDLVDKNTELENELAAKEASNVNLSIKLSEVEAELKKYTGQSSGNAGTTLVVAADNHVKETANNGKISLNDPNHPLNLAAAKKIEAAKHRS